MCRKLLLTSAAAVVSSIISMTTLAPMAISAPAGSCQKTPDRPYEPGETWCKYPGYWTVTGRTVRPLWQKLNPLWWFGNDFEPVAPAWYLPSDPARGLKWYLRNPLQNAGNYVFGTKDLNYTVRFVRGPAGVTNYADTNATGCIYTLLDNSHGGNLWFPRTYVSCTNQLFTWYAGTQWSGFYGFKFNVQHSKFQLF